MLKKILVCLVLLLVLGCANNNTETNGEQSTENHQDANKLLVGKDKHSYARPEEVVVKHLDLEIDVNFEDKIIVGTASYDIENKTGTDAIYFDMNGLTIDGITLGDDKVATTYEIKGDDHHLGSALKVVITSETKKVNISYRTSKDARALQWLDAQQTAGKKMPFLFTQSQAILARTWIPCQDGPGIRFTYNANVKVPEGMMALMSAENPTERSANGYYNFSMKQPIPSYLMALAVGDINFVAVGERTGVYAEPSMIDKSAYEFGEMEEMLVKAEALYGSYVWDRYDLIVLPPSFPFGGMENPRLTFATPTIIAGDKSLVALVAHELAHSWSGNLVTNKTWDDFWLNEGFTVYFEQRIMEAVYGREYSEMLAILTHQEMVEEIDRIILDTIYDDTHLKLDLSGRDPDEGLTAVAYNKGYFFLRMVEETVGREKFDAFLKNYFTSHAFQVMDTEGFVAYLRDELIGDDLELAEKININDWIYGPGVPENCPQPVSEKFNMVDAELAVWKGGKPAKELNVSDWSTHEWIHFLRNLPDSMSNDQLVDLDSAFDLTNSGNSEIIFAWFMRTIPNDYEAAVPALENFLMDVGRRKFIAPLYNQLKISGKLEWAKEIYAKARPNYHSVSTGTIDETLGFGH